MCEALCCLRILHGSKPDSPPCNAHLLGYLFLRWPSTAESRRCCELGTPAERAPCNPDMEEGRSPEDHPTHLARKIRPPWIAPCGPYLLSGPATESRCKGYEIVVLLARIFSGVDNRFMVWSEKNFVHHLRNQLKSFRP